MKKIGICNNKGGVLKDSVMFVESVTLGRPITDFAPKSEHAEAHQQIKKLHQPDPWVAQIIRTSPGNRSEV